MNKDDISVEDILEGKADLPYRTVLELWKNVLDNVDNGGLQRITMEWATAVTTVYKEMTFAKMPAFRDSFYKKLREMRALLQEVIDEDEERTAQTSAEEDVAYNGTSYIGLIAVWQMKLLEWELTWDCKARNAIVEHAAISETQRIFFSSKGLVTLLDSINFEMTEDDNAALIEKMLAYKDSIRAVMKEPRNDD